MNKKDKELNRGKKTKMVYPINNGISSGNVKRIRDVVVSVIVPVYDVEDYIEECVSSILRQTYSNIEVIIVNDGSTDNSLSVCKELAKTDSRIKIFTRKNGGLSRARNFGISKARGKYIFFLDGDDLIQNNTIEVLLCLLNKKNNSISLCGFESFRERTHYYAYDNDAVEYKPIEYFKSVLELKNNTYACGVLIPKRLLNSSFFTEDRYFEDMASMYKLYSSCDSIIKTDCQLYKYRRNPNSIVHTVDDNKINDRMKSAIEFIDFSKTTYMFEDDILDIYRCESFKDCYIMSGDINYLLEAKELSRRIKIEDVSLKNKIKFLLLRNIVLYKIVLSIKKYLWGIVT